ncbi:MAG: hypothetical protein AMJ55_00410 [Gammaproteobacteria bacterium SG8_15]|nr:MAG: hypothetical protein AMJ55_00410 [Gammaproteobacteria bacterium SG8_15]
MSKRRVLTINNMPLRGGLTTAGQQGSIAENQLWGAQNCYAGLDGLISKCPGLEQWGQVLKLPAGLGNIYYYEPFTDLTNWVESNSSEDHFDSVTNNGQLRLSVFPTTAGTETYNLGWIPDGTLTDSGGDTWSIRFTQRCNNMPSDATWTLMVRSDTGETGCSFQFTDTVVNYWNGASWAALSTTDATVGDGVPHTIEIRWDGTTATLLIDEVENATATGCDLHQAFSTSSYIEIEVETDNTLSDRWTFYLYDFMFDDDETSSAFVASRMSSGTDFKVITGRASVRRYLMVGSVNYVYVDYALTKSWAPLLKLSGIEAQFAQFQDQIIIFDGDDGFSTQVYSWNGEGTVQILDDAPNVRFGTEHRTRLFAAGDRNHPLRVYFTASRQPNVWFAPDVDPDETYDEVVNAGYLIIPGKRGDSITGLYGEYYGSVIVTTNRGAWRITGASPQSFQVQNITQDVGAGGQACIERMGNDLWLAGRQGFTTLMTSERFGDIKAQSPSAPIADMWDLIPNQQFRVDQDAMDKASVAWNPTLGLLYFAFQQVGAADVSAVYVFNVANGQWYGPWITDTTFVSSVEVASPVIQVVMHGTSDGRVGVTDINWKMNFDQRMQLIFESPYLNGRSLDARLQHQKKTWKHLRLFVQPRGAWDLELEWQTDITGWQTRTVTQNVFNVQTISEDFRLTVDKDGVLHSNQLIGTIEIPLDARGRYIKFRIKTAEDYDGEDLVLQGYEVDFVPDGPEREGI